MMPAEVESQKLFGSDASSLTRLGNDEEVGVEYLGTSQRLDDSIRAEHFV